MNNNMFVLKRYLDDLGYKESTLFLLDEFEHFLPERDTYDLSRIGHVVNLGWTEFDFWKLSKTEIKKTFNGYDFFIGVAYAAAFLHKANIRLNIFIASGSDVIFNPFYKFKHFPPKKWEIGSFFLSRAQRLGIKKSVFVWSAWKNDFFLSALVKIRGNQKKTIEKLPHFLYLPQYNKIKDIPYHNQKLHSYLRESYDCIFFHHAAHRWTRGVYKCNDWLIKAFANFLKNSKRKKSACLILLEYGIDLEESKSLVKDLGIDNHVFWLPQSTRKKLMLDIYYLCDFGFGQFGRSWMHYGVILEFMALSKPFCAQRDDDLYRNDYETLYPMVNATNIKEIENAMLNFIENQIRFEQMGKDANYWLTNQYVESTETLTRVLSSNESFL